MIAEIDQNSNFSQTNLALDKKTSFNEKGATTSIHGSNGMLSFNPSSNLNKP